MQIWEEFYKEKLTDLLTQHQQVVDLGGGLRIRKEREFQYDPTRGWLQDLVQMTDYKIMDPVSDYNPDILGDVHSMPFANDSVPAIVCDSVLEHVANPIVAMKEIHRVLKPGGVVFVYMPFLFFYHAGPGYPKDYWRFSHDAIELLFRDFSEVETVKVRGAVSSWFYLSPLGRYRLIRKFSYWLDSLFKKHSSNQVSGYYIYAHK